MKKRLVIDNVPIWAITSVAKCRRNQGKTDLSLTCSLAKEIIHHIEQKEDLFIPDYEIVYKNVLDRYHEDFRKEGRHSYEYKLKSGRIN